MVQRTRLIRGMEEVKMKIGFRKPSLKGIVSARSLAVAIVSAALAAFVQGAEAKGGSRTSGGSKSSSHASHATGSKSNAGKKSVGSGSKPSSQASQSAASKRSGSGSASKSNTPSPGTGSKAGSTTVKGHLTKDGKYIPAHQRSTPDKSFTNNYSTKGNTNPYTGKPGSRAAPPGKN